MVALPIMNVVIDTTEFYATDLHFQVLQGPPLEISELECLALVTSLDCSGSGQLGAVKMSLGVRGLYGEENRQ